MALPISSKCHGRRQGCKWQRSIRHIGSIRCRISSMSIGAAYWRFDLRRLGLATSKISLQTLTGSSAAARGQEPCQPDDHDAVGYGISGDYEIPPAGPTPEAESADAFTLSIANHGRRPTPIRKATAPAVTCFTGFTTSTTQRLSSAIIFVTMQRPGERQPGRFIPGDTWQYRQHGQTWMIFAPTFPPCLSTWNMASSIDDGQVVIHGRGRTNPLGMLSQRGWQ